MSGQRASDDVRFKIERIALDGDRNQLALLPLGASAGLYPSPRDLAASKVNMRRRGILGGSVSHLVTFK
jgi:hypothetical protein